MGDDSLEIFRIEHRERTKVYGINIASTNTTCNKTINGFQIIPPCFDYQTKPSSAGLSMISRWSRQLTSYDCMKQVKSYSNIF